MLSLDIGCGFLDILNPEPEADVSLDLNLDKASPSLIRKLKIPIIGDAQNLPFRNDIFYNIYWNAILEHLPDPVKSLIEGKKTLRKNGEARIKLPVITNLERRYLKHIVFAFPFSIIGTLRHLIRHYRYYRIKGVTHLREINPSHLKPFFRKCEVTVEWGKHAWFTGFKGRILRRILKREPVHDFHGQYIIRCVK